MGLLPVHNNLQCKGFMTALCSVSKKCTCTWSLARIRNGSGLWTLLKSEFKHQRATAVIKNRISKYNWILYLQSWCFMTITDWRLFFTLSFFPTTVRAMIYEHSDCVRVKTWHLAVFPCKSLFKTPQRIITLSKIPNDYLGFRLKHIQWLGTKNFPRSSARLRVAEIELARRTWG